MSEDERDIDVELDDGDLGGMDDEGGSLAGDDGIPENKRALHNAMERKRRDSIKDSFRGLQECIPTLRGDKTSRAQVLKKTGDYIVHMQKKISNHQDEIKELKNQNTQLEAQIRALEKAKASGGFVGGGDLLEASLLENGIGFSSLPDRVESLVTKDDLELDTIDSQEIVYDDNSSDNSECQGLAVLPGMVDGLPNGRAPTRMTVSLPSAPGVTVSLPPASVAPLATGQTVTVVQPGKSLLTSTAIRVQPGQSLLLSEPLRKKMKFLSRLDVLLTMILLCSVHTFVRVPTRSMALERD